MSHPPIRLRAMYDEYGKLFGFEWNVETWRVECGPMEAAMVWVVLNGIKYTPNPPKTSVDKVVLDFYKREFKRLLQQYPEYFI